VFTLPCKFIERYLLNTEISGRRVEKEFIFDI